MSARAPSLLTGGAAEADELTQEAMVRVYERLRNLTFVLDAETDTLMDN